MRFALLAVVVALTVSMPVDGCTNLYQRCTVDNDCCSTACGISCSWSNKLEFVSLSKDSKQATIVMKKNRPWTSWRSISPALKGAESELSPRNRCHLLTHSKIKLAEEMHSGLPESLPSKSSSNSINSLFLKTVGLRAHGGVKARHRSYRWIFQWMLKDLQSTRLSFIVFATLLFTKARLIGITTS
ncbi:uncharacterized protein EDB93DRAFT_1334524 [Suillus bovinus]|uniref:uncharacterized protein n=1 Tax=Suillus bovinus TaxID=48563 RepID=UPI001B860A74|nr:uncharacterized protein EDB93DRAFT_1334524 [Suillus bovinus]KAG2158584.1 hypothetical protein EDB93DRAFT_1334524 [Suillus bovinus]